VQELVAAAALDMLEIVAEGSRLIIGPACDAWYSHAFHSRICNSIPAERLLGALRNFEYGHSTAERSHALLVAPAMQRRGLDVFAQLAQPEILRLVRKNLHDRPKANRLGNAVNTAGGKWLIQGIEKHQGRVAASAAKAAMLEKWALVNNWRKNEVEAAMGAAGIPFPSNLEGGNQAVDNLRKQVVHCGADLTEEQQQAAREAAATAKAAKATAPKAPKKVARAASTGGRAAPAASKRKKAVKRAAGATLTRRTCCLCLGRWR
jgi:hypothetical protein